MTEAIDAISDSLPPKRRRSKLDPHAALIRALRRRGRTYREIVTILRERCGTTVALHTLHHFVRAATQNQSVVATRVRSTTSTPRPKTEVTPSVSAASEDLRRRIATLKARATPAGRAEPKAFAYDDTEALQLVRPHPGKE
jgi:hypothetical protein